MKSLDALKKNQIGMLGCHVCFAALELFISVFLAAKLYFLTDGNIVSVALFNVVQYAAIFLFFGAFSYVTKRYSRVWSIRLGAMLAVALVILTLFWQAGLKDYYLFFAAIFGAAQGIYWCAIHALESEALGTTRMSNFKTYYHIAVAAIKIIFPFTLGALIEFVNFGTASALVFGVGIILVAFTLFLSETKPDGSRFSIRSYMKTVKGEKLEKPVRLNFWIHYLYGLHNTAALCVTLLVSMAFESDFSLGSLFSIFSASSIAVLAVYKLISNSGGKKTAYYIASAVPLAASLGLLFAVNPVTVILFHAGYTSLSVVPRMENDTLRLNMMSILGHGELRLEATLHSEAALFGGRLTTMGLISLFYLVNALYLFRVMTVLLMAVMLLCAFLVRLWNKKYGF